MIVAVGITSCSSSSRFGPISTFKAVMPVTLPPGWFRLGDKPNLDRVAPYREDNRNGCSSRFSRHCRRSSAGGRNHVHLTVNQFGRQSRQSIVMTFRPAIFDRHILALDISCLFQSQVATQSLGRGVPPA